MFYWYYTRVDTIHVFSVGFNADTWAMFWASNQYIILGGLCILFGIIHTWRKSRGK